MLVLSQNLVLTEADAAVPGAPLIGWRNLVTFENVTAETEAVGFPASNVSNPATHLEWRAADTTAQEFAIAVNSEEDIDYVGIARHNFGSEAISVEVGYYDEDEDWVNLAGPQMPGDDGPLVFRFTPQSLAEVIISLGSGNAAARMGVVYVGKLLAMERGVVVDADLPLSVLARKTDKLNGMSESGNYLGRVVLNQFLEWNANFAHLTPSWYRTNFKPFVQAAQDDTPFFYVWSPVGFPLEVAFSWLVDDPIPMVSGITGRHAVSLKCRGIVE